MPTAKSGVRLTRGITEYAHLVEQRSGVPVTVTSGGRDPREQAQAMLKKLREKGPSELRTLYRSNGSLVEELLRTTQSVDAWAAVIRSRGSRLSRHLWNGAMDVRTRDLSTTQVAKLRAVVAATGGRSLLEYDHLHVDLPARYAGMSAVETAATFTAKSAARGLALMAILGVGAVAVAVALRWRSGQKSSKLIEMHGSSRNQKQLPPPSTATTLPWR